MNNFIFFCILITLPLTPCKNIGNTKNSPSNDVVPGGIVASTIHPDSIKGAFLKPENTTYDFGKVSRKNSPNIAIKIEVENVGKHPLVIIKGDVSCGCLSVEFPKRPIMMGEKAQLIVNVDTKSQAGLFNKSIFIKSNADNDVVLIRITGEVKE